VIRRTVPAIVFAALVISGCAPQQPISQYSPGESLVADKVSTAGIYALFEEGQDDPVARYDLVAGDKIGFEVNEMGTVGALKVNIVYAVAGKHHVIINRGTHYAWRRVDD